MKPEQIIEMAKSRGVFLYADGDKIKFQAPNGAMTPELKTIIRENKQAVLTELERATDGAFDVLDSLLSAGRITTMDRWRADCRAVGIGELAIWKIRVEVEPVVSFSDGQIALRDSR
jgi:hypothetical protein